MDTVRAMDERAIAAAKIADATREEAAELEEITRAYAKIEAKDKVRKERKGAEDEAREKGQNSFVNGLIASGRDSAVTGNGTTSKHDFLRAQYKNAVSTVSQEMGTDSIDVQAPEIQEKIR
jgi:membrane protein involved in colicin uptake